MPKTAHDQLMAWLDERIRILGWNDSQLAKKAGLKPSTISKARSGTQPMKWDALVAIARAIDVRPELVLRIAGFLPPEPGKSTEMEEWDSIFDRLSDEDRAELLEMAHFKAARRGWPWHRR